MPFAQARCKPVLCFAHVTNQMGCVEGDIEKGEAEGATPALALIHAVAEARGWGVLNTLPLLSWLKVILAVALPDLASSPQPPAPTTSLRAAILRLKSC